MSPALILLYAASQSFFMKHVSSLSTIHILSDRSFQRQPSHSSSLSMADKSCVTTFTLGETVQVVADVYKEGKNLRGIVGNVIETWEKCDVDPTCCCAEFVDDGYAVRVEFNRTDLIQSDDRSLSNNLLIHGISNSRHYFSVDEIQKI